MKKNSPVFPLPACETRFTNEKTRGTCLRASRERQGHIYVMHAHATISKAHHQMGFDGYWSYSDRAKSSLSLTCGTLVFFITYRLSHGFA